MLYFLSEKGLKLASINPKQVRDFAKASGKLAKTDKIDSKVIAMFVEVFSPPVVKVPDGETIELNAFVVRRKQLMNMLVSEKNRFSSCPSKASKQSLRKHMKWLEKEISSLEDNISNMLKNSPQWQTNKDVLKSVPGVGAVLTFSLLSGLTELGQITSRKVSALAGLAPMNRDSGKFKGKRFTQGGRIDIRTALY
ncbi:IS110 family transposase, partial [bacterium]